MYKIASQSFESGISFFVDEEKGEQKTPKNISIIIHRAKLQCQERTL